MDWRSEIGEIMKKEKTYAIEIIHDLKIIIILLIIALVGSNIAWLVYESQWEEVESTTVNGDSATYLENSESGDINYGNYTQSN